MRDPRNPFRLRASEQIASETTFLRLFGAGILDVLPEDSLLGLPVFFRSAPGGGKTSLLRLFTPQSMLTLYANRNHEDYKELYARMKQLGAVNDGGPLLLGVMLSCGKNYSSLVDLPWEKLRMERFFFALLNVRIILATLRAASYLHALEYPSELEQMTIEIDPDIGLRLGVPRKSSGAELFKWSSDIEVTIGKALDSLDPSVPEASGHESLFGLEILRPDKIKVRGRPVADHILVMLDDVHKLAPSQHSSLGQYLTGSRLQVPIWIAERLEALSEEQLLDLGAKHGRDYSDRSRTLERYWHEYPARFQRLVMNIADKRVKEARSVEIGSFAECLQASFDSANLQAKMHDVLERVRTRILSKYEQINQFKHWLKTKDNLAGSAYEQALSWRSLEVLVAREERKSQLDLGLILTPEELTKKDDSAVKAAAELFLARESKLPYYFGFERLVNLSSSNIEQFLTIGGDLFEEASSASILSKPTQLSPERQHLIVKKVAKKWWEEEVLRSISRRGQVRMFIESIGRLARWETEKSNAPYAPGVTGIGISMSEREKLKDQKQINQRPDLQDLASVIAICLAHNILEVELERSQGYDQWMLLYLNRILCAHFDLPTQYGGWRPRKLDELSRWLKDGFRPPDAADERLAI